MINFPPTVSRCSCRPLVQNLESALELGLTLDHFQECAFDLLVVEFFFLFLFFYAFGFLLGFLLRCLLGFLSVSSRVTAWFWAVVVDVVIVLLIQPLEKSTWSDLSGWRSIAHEKYRRPWFLPRFITFLITHLLTLTSGISIESTSSITTLTLWLHYIITLRSVPIPVVFVCVCVCEKWKEWREREREKCNPYCICMYVVELNWKKNKREREREREKCHMPLPIVFVEMKIEKNDERESRDFEKTSYHAFTFFGSSVNIWLNLHLFPLVHLFSRNHLHVSLILLELIFLYSLSLSLSNLSLSSLKWPFCVESVMIGTWCAWGVGFFALCVIMVIMAMKKNNDESTKHAKYTFNGWWKEIDIRSEKIVFWG